MSLVLARCARSTPSHFTEKPESLALECIAGALRAGGLQTTIADAEFEGLDRDSFVARLVGDGPAMVGFTIADPSYIRPTYAVARGLRSAGYEGHITLGGHAPTFSADDVLAQCPEISSVAMHEGEETVVELARRLTFGEEWRDIDGIAFRDGDKTIRNRPRPLIRNLDSLPFPDRAYYHDVRDDLDTALVSRSRGCYGNCGFCSIRAFYDAAPGPAWRTRSAENVVDELEELQTRYGVQEVFFVDDIFVGPGEQGKQDVFALADGMEKRKLRSVFSIGERPDTLDLEILARLKSVGLTHVLLGLEGGTQRQLDYFGKGTTVEQNATAIETVRSLGLDISAAFINFTPETTLEDLKANLEFFYAQGVDFLQGLLNRLQVYRGTPIGERMIAEGRVQGGFPRFDYEFFDPRTATAWRIVHSTLGGFLHLAYRMKAIRRRIRRAEHSQDRGELKRIRRGARCFEDCCKRLLSDARELAHQILEFCAADAGAGGKSSDVAEYIGRTKPQVRDWIEARSKELTLVTGMSPDLSRIFGRQEPATVQV